MANFEIVLLNYVRDLLNDGDLRDKFRIMAMKITDVAAIAINFGDVNEENSNEENYYDDDFLNSYWVEFFTSTSSHCF
jgi:hypothetical protein